MEDPLPCMKVRVAEMEVYRRETANAKVSSWTWEHNLKVHNGVRGNHNGLTDYEPIIYGAFLEALLRTLDEGVRIKDVMDDPRVECLNSKNEYFKPQYSRLSFRGLLMD